MDFGIFVDTELVVTVHVEIVPGVGLPEEQIEHLQEALHIAIGEAAAAIQFRQVVHHLRRADFINVPLPEPGAKVVFPEAVLLAFGSVCPVTSAISTVFLIDLLNSFPYRGLWLAGVLGAVNSRLPRLDCLTLCFEGCSEFIFCLSYFFADAVHHENIAISPIPILQFVNTRVILLCHLQIPLVDFFVAKSQIPACENVHLWIKKFPVSSFFSPVPRRRTAKPFGFGLYWEKAAYEEAEHAAKFAELLGEVVTDSTKKNLEMRVEAENGATLGKFELAKLAKQYNLDAIHDTVHEMARDEARHGKAFEGLLKRYFG